MAEIAQRPNSNLPTKQQQWRDEVQAAFQIAPEQLMFIGEMLDVAEMHRDWQGAIERALGGLRTTLLVPKNQFAPINQWLNARHMNAHIRLQAVDLTNVPAVEFQKKGYLSKLMWREHAYQDWLRHFLQIWQILQMCYLGACIQHSRMNLRQIIKFSHNLACFIAYGIRF